MPLHSLRRPVATSVGVAALVVLGLAAPAAATTPGRDGLVAYVDRSGGLSTVDVRSTAAPRTVLRSNTLASPRWNPTGRRIAYVDTATGAVRTVPATGGSTSAVYVPATGGPRGSDPTWSPPTAAGGQQLAFVRTPRGGRGDVWVVRTDQGHAVGAPSRLTYDGAQACGDVSPDWSPDGTRIAYRRLLRNAAGTCSTLQGDLPVQTVVRTLRTGATQVLPAAPAGSPLSGSVRWYADGTRLLVGKSYGDDGCSTSWLAYGLADRTYATVGSGSVCGTEADLAELVPTPAGQQASVVDDFVDDPQGGHGLYTLEVPGASRQVEGGRQPWRQVDVQPLPAGG